MKEKRKQDQIKLKNKKTVKPSLKTIAVYPKHHNNLISSNWFKLLETYQTNKINKEKKQNKKKMKNISEGKKLHQNKDHATNQIEEVWFDGVDEELLDLSEKQHRPKNKYVKNSHENNPLIVPGQHKSITKAVAMDCEMVGIGIEGKDSIVARVSIVNSLGHCIYDKYVKPREDVTDYRTAVSGIRPDDIQNGEEFEIVQKEVYDIIKSKILVGHAIHHDLQVLYLDHPKKKIRDTSRYKVFRKISAGHTPSLKKLTEHFLKIKVQEGEHDSVQDAQAAMRLYTMYRKKWEFEIKKTWKQSKKK